MSLARVINLDDFRARARRRLPRIAFDFIDGGADDEACLARNREAFGAFRLLPRYLRNVDHRDQTTELFGRRYASPFGISPTGLAGLFRADADAMLAAAAHEADVPFLLSSAANISIERAMEIAPGNVWFQVYATRDAAINADLLRRARAAGVDVLVLSVDVPVNANRERNRRNGFTRPFRMTPSIVLDALGHPGWVLRYLRNGGLPMMRNWQPYARPGASAAEVSDLYGKLTPAGGTDWNTLADMRDAWPGALVVKGLLHPEDVLRAREAGVDGVIVSNHGGRQLDAAPSPIEMLPAIRSAVGPDFPLLLDSGVRRGSDVVIARCLGARACISGRPTLFAVASDGQPGVAHALSILRREVDAVLAQMGCPVFDALDARYLDAAPQGAVVGKPDPVALFIANGSNMSVTGQTTTTGG